MVMKFATLDLTGRGRQTNLLSLTMDINVFVFTFSPACEQK